MHWDKRFQYVHRVGTDNQYRVFWNGTAWCYELLAGGVIFDEQTFSSENALIEGLAFHGLSPNQFTKDESGAAEQYSQQMLKKQKIMKDAGLKPCSKHGLSSLNSDNTCEACQNTDYPDDFKGTEG